MSRSPGRAAPAGARCICKETSAHWPAGGGACGAGPIKGRPGERGAGGRGGDEVTIGHSAEPPPPAGPDWAPRGAGMGASGRGAAGPARCCRGERGREDGEWRCGGEGIDERQRRGGPLRELLNPLSLPRCINLNVEGKIAWLVFGFFILLWNLFVILVEARISSQSHKEGKKNDVWECLWREKARKLEACPVLFLLHGFRLTQCVTNPFTPLPFLRVPQVSCLFSKDESLLQIIVYGREMCVCLVCHCISFSTQHQGKAFILRLHPPPPTHTSTPVQTKQSKTQRTKTTTPV